MSKFVHMLNNLPCTLDRKPRQSTRVRDVNKGNKFTYLVLGGDGLVSLQEKTLSFATYAPNPRRSSIPLTTRPPPPFRRTKGDGNQRSRRYRGCDFHLLTLDHSMQQIGCGGSGKDRRGGEREGMRGDEKGPQDLQRAGEKATARGSLSMDTSRARGYAGEKNRKERKIGYALTVVLYAWVLSCC